ncbi:MAG: hypothetical protein ACFCD0_06655 [Gemmataceae bacterium]
MVHLQAPGAFRVCLGYSIFDFKSWVPFAGRSPPNPSEAGIIASEAGIIASEAGIIASEAGIIASEAGIIASEAGYTASERFLDGGARRLRTVTNTNTNRSDTTSKLLLGQVRKSIPQSRRAPSPNRTPVRPLDLAVRFAFSANSHTRYNDIHEIIS